MLMSPPLRLRPTGHTRSSLIGRLSLRPSINKVKLQKPHDSVDPDYSYKFVPEKL